MSLMKAGASTMDIGSMHSAITRCNTNTVDVRTNTTINNNCCRCPVDATDCEVWLAARCLIQRCVAKSLNYAVIDMSGAACKIRHGIGLQ